MALTTLESLKQSLRHKATTTSSSAKRPLSDSQYSAGFEILLGSSGWLTYQDFIIPQLSALLDPLVNSGVRISVLEVGPGPKSVLGYLPSYMRRSIGRYSAFEPNELFVLRLKEWLYSTSGTGIPLPCLESPPDIHRIPFVVDSSASFDGMGDGADKFNVILFCHSMYGMKPKSSFIKRALELLVERPGSGFVVVFHREETLHLDGLTCHQTTSFPTGVTRVADDDMVLDRFAPFIAGFAMQDEHADKSTRAEWRKVCRTLGHREQGRQDQLLFSSPEIMAAFTRHATALTELTSQVPLGSGDGAKNRQARLRRPASIVRPTDIRHVQQCVCWALDHGVGLTVISGGHSGHCLWPNVVSIDMGAFDQVHIVQARGEGGSGPNIDSGFLVVAQAGCKTGDIVRKAMAAGLTVPMGARPSLGAGLWLQGGIGHLARLHGLACDAIVGAVMVSVANGRVLCIGRVPSQHRPIDAVCPDNEDDLLWAMKGAGTNFGVVISVTFKACLAPVYSIRNWVIPLSDRREAQLKLGDFDKLVAAKSPRNSSVDAYLYWERDMLCLGVSMIESSTANKLAFGAQTHTPTPMSRLFGPEDNYNTVNGVGLFEAEMYMSGMHGGHGGSKTSSFKRCLFLKHIGEASMIEILVTAIKTRPSPLCYLHLLQGGGAVCDVAADTTAFGCRDWDFACVVTGVWSRDQDGTEAVQAAVQWVYNVAAELLPLSSGVYGADLGPDPRDAALAAKAFGPNRPRLIRLKQISDPRKVLAYTCPLVKAPMAPTLIILVTGESCAGKDYCADTWVSVITSCASTKLTARVIAIGDTTKREYAEATGANLQRLLRDRRYKEQHRAALTAFFQEQLRHRPQLREEHFLNAVKDAMDMDVLLITGMRDKAPVAAFSHLVPSSRLLEVRIQASNETRRARGSCRISGDNDDGTECYPPSLLFHNDLTGNEAAKKFAQTHLLAFFHENLQRLASMVRPVPGFPRPGIEFRHVLDISQQPGGLGLCTSLLQAHFTGDWAKVDLVACCEVGGFVYASASALRVGASLALIREAGKLPPPTISVRKSSSHISSCASHDAGEKGIEVGLNIFPRGTSVVVVDDVLATGKTLCAVLQLLDEAGISADKVDVMVVAEFPIHRGRELLRRRGFGGARIQSLLVFDGA
ncbi:Adenine phosphoribosyltransferase [Metarhizium brunneum]|uniref:Adenine phosphoribosyltransferase n=1 Tax=Metarhizium brunneum TaxID=500148 RepID=A0A7D5Z7G0_9HYPO